MPSDPKSLNHNWLLSQYWYLVGQIQSRDAGFIPPLDEESALQADDHTLSRMVTDLKRLANVPPSRS